MKRKQTVALPKTWAAPPECAKSARVMPNDRHSYPKFHAQANHVLLFLLDLAQSTGDPGFLGLAKAAATHLAGCLRRFTREERPRFTDIALKGELSNSAFALAEAWKTTRDPIYRQVGLEVICFVDEMDLAAE